MILPEPALSGEPVVPLGIESEGDVGRVNWDGARSGGVNADSDDRFGGGTGLLECAANRPLEAGEIIGGGLAGQVMIARIKEHALMSVFIVVDGKTEFLAGGRIDGEGADRVGSVIDTERNLHRFKMPNDSIVTNSGLLDSNVAVRTHQDAIQLRRIAGEALCLLVWRRDGERIPDKKRE
jgi:hypothetical protein